jgi:UPF0755 protein
MSWLPRLARRLLLVAVLGAGAAAAVLFAYAHLPLSWPSPAVSFDVRSGSSLRSVAAQLSAAGVIGRPEPFELLARLLGESGRLKAGNYELDAPVTPLELLRRMTRGDVTLVAVTFVEGWTFAQVRKVLQEHPKVRSELAGLDEREAARRIGIDAESPEGWIFPDTYHFTGGSSDVAILQRAHRLMRRHLEEQWQQRAPGLPLKTPYEALILASIVEKETGRAEERPLVAAVFINRLRIGMRLQTDPTVIYGIGAAFDGDLRKRDLLADTPYNTYTRNGLPPTPIAMPGLDALRATLNPAASDVLYFVARGDGSSKFSRTLAEHERAVTQYQRRGRP